MVIFYPFIEQGAESHAAFSFACDVLEDLRIRLGTALEGVENREEIPEEISCKPETEDFFLSTFPSIKLNIKIFEFIFCFISFLQCN